MSGENHDSECLSVASRLPTPRGAAPPALRFVPTLVAAFFYLGPLTPLWIEPGKEGTVDTHFVAVAVAILLAMLWWQHRPAVAGGLFGLACATRSELALLAPALTLHYFRRGRPAAATFVAAATGVAGLIVLPFLLRDPAAFDWALRGHVASRLADSLPVLWQWPWLSLDEAGYPRAGVAPLLPYNGAIMFVAIAGTTLMFRRDRWLERYLLLVGLAHALTLPVFHNRYVSYVYALALLYSAGAGVAHLFAVWFLVTSHTSHTPLTLGLPWLAVAWQSLRRFAPAKREPKEMREGREMR